jgi:hypothetical protein
MEAEFILVWDGDMLAFNFHFILTTCDLAFWRDRNKPAK